MFIIMLVREGENSAGRRAVHRQYQYKKQKRARAFIVLL